MQRSAGHLYTGSTFQLPLAPEPKSHEKIGQHDGGGVVFLHITCNILNWEGLSSHAELLQFLSNLTIFPAPGFPYDRPQPALKCLALTLGLHNVELTMPEQHVE